MYLWNPEQFGYTCAHVSVPLAQHLRGCDYFQFWDHLPLMSGIWSAKMVTDKYSHLYRHVPMKSSRLHLDFLCVLCWPTVCDRSDSCCLNSRPRPQETRQLLLPLVFGTHYVWNVMKLTYSSGHTTCKEESNPIISMNQRVCKQTTMYHQVPEECKYIKVRPSDTM